MCHEDCNEYEKREAKQVSRLRIVFSFYVDVSNARAVHLAQGKRQAATLEAEKGGWRFATRRWENRNNLTHSITSITLPSPSSSLSISSRISRAVLHGHSIEFPAAVGPAPAWVYRS